MMNIGTIASVVKGLAFVLAFFLYSTHVYKAGQNSVTVKQQAAVIQEAKKNETATDYINSLDDLALRNELREQYSRKQ